MMRMYWRHMRAKHSDYLWLLLVDDGWKPQELVIDGQWLPRHPGFLNILSQGFIPSKSPKWSTGHMPKHRLGPSGGLTNNSSWYRATECMLFGFATYEAYEAKRLRHLLQLPSCLAASEWQIYNILTLGEHLWVEDPTDPKGWQVWENLWVRSC